MANLRIWFSPHGTEWNAETYEEALEKERDSLVEQLEAVQRWFHTKPWEGAIDGSSHGGENRDWTPAERALGYGTYRDPRYLPALLTSNPAKSPKE